MATETEPLDVLTIGEMVVDFISVEKTDTLSNASTFRRYLGGSPANIAVYVSKLGATSAVLAKTGIGAFGKFLKSELQRHGVTTDYLLMDHRTHTTVIFISSTAATPDFEEFRSGDYLLRPEEISEEAVSRARIVHTSAFALSKDPQRLAVRRAMRLGSRLGKIVTLDPNYDPRVWPDKVEAWEVLAEAMPYVTIVKPSLEDTRRLFDVNMDEETLEETAISEFHDLGAKIVILTRSGGIVTVSDNGNVERVGPLPKVEVSNVTGARDAFWSALLMAHLDGKDWPEAIRSAHEVASLKLRVERHVERMIDRESLYAGLKPTGQGPRSR
jgi:sugar/nucleoside kinase (ribokinase family)